MLTIDTGFKAVAAPASKVYAYLADLNNWQGLMPDRVVNWRSDADSCGFTIKGMADINLRILERSAETLLKLEAYDKTPFPFKLDIQIREAGSGAEACIVFNGEVNMFLRMVVEEPLKNFFTMLLEKLPSQVEA
jgi:hypothetical protein